MEQFGVLLAEWATYGIAFGTSSQSRIVEFGAISHLKETLDATEQFLEEKGTLDLGGGSKLLVHDKRTLKVSLLPLEISEQELEVLTEDQRKLVGSVAFACWQEGKTLFRII